jgi:hypothetical protein
MRKPTKPNPGGDAEALKKEPEDSGRPAAPPEDAEALSEDLEGAGDGKPMPDHEDEL